MGSRVLWSSNLQVFCQLSREEAGWDEDKEIKSWRWSLQVGDDSEVSRSDKHIGCASQYLG